MYNIIKVFNKVQHCEAIFDMAKREKAIIDEKVCDAKRNCPAVRACPFGFITQIKIGFLKAEIPVINTLKCVGCGRCIAVCDQRAIHFKDR